MNHFWSGRKLHRLVLHDLSPALPEGRREEQLGTDVLQQPQQLRNPSVDLYHYGRGVGAVDLAQGIDLLILLLDSACRHCRTVRGSRHTAANQIHQQSFSQHFGSDEKLHPNVYGSRDLSHTAYNKGNLWSPPSCWRLVHLRTGKNAYQLTGKIARRKHEVTFKGHRKRINTLC